MEVWKVCVEDYEISNRGNVRRKTLSGGYKDIKGSLLKTGGGYKYFQLLRDGKRKNHLFHHLVAEQFLGARPDGLVIDHIDRNPLNNCVDNLRYITQKANCFNHDKVHTDIPQDMPNRHAAVCKKYRESNKEKISTHNKEKLLCAKCNTLICRAWMIGHSRKCDGTNPRSRSGRKKGDTTCILNIYKVSPTE